MNDEQQQEVEALLSIFGPTECCFRDDGCELNLPYGEQGTAIATLQLGAGYPVTAPQISLSGLPRGLTEALVVHLHSVSAAHAGEPHLYQIVQALRSWLGLDDVPQADEQLVQATTDEDEDAAKAVAVACAIPIAHGTHGCGVCIDRKSVFQAHVAPVHSREEVASVLHTLYCEPKIARATHNIVAYRFWHAATGTWTCEGDDDGEDGAAYKLAQMLDHMDVRDAVVVVSRWYGGILLGPVRFHHINTVGKQLLEREGYGKDAAGGGVKRKGR